MIHRHFDQEKKQCSNCGILLTKQTFPYHFEKECRGIWFNNKKLEEEIRRYKEFNNQGAGI
jgi:hypothetical protein